MSHLPIKEEQAKRRAAVVSLSYNLTATGVKLVAALLTGSVSLLSEALHSATDVVASFFAYLGVRIGATPPDEQHPYGHGKVETLAGFGESILLILIVAYLMFEGARRLIVGGELERLEWGVGVMALSTVTSLIVGQFVWRTGKRTHSLALMSNGQHLMIDFWTSLGLLMALGIIYFTGWVFIDALLAIGIALWLFWGAWRLATRAFHELIDHCLPQEELALIDQILRSEPNLLNYHNLRTRRAGALRYIDVHIVLPNDWSLQQAHNVADALEKRIKHRLHPAEVTIHVDPYDPEREALREQKNLYREMLRG
ncbi:MAG: cation-efflux pump [Armatimonadetes bacterium JP3_11]|nr:MAG: cation-efflux pump [Armatimonadetes bacterium JP3_11]RMH10464.1 MAG: cation transporter [Armatimonadota bacterium]